MSDGITDSERANEAVIKKYYEELNYEMIEKLAALEHEQWVYWSQQIAKVENISPDRLARWKTLWVPYYRLSENDKEQDRSWARKAVDLLTK